MTDTPLTDKQITFCNEFLIDLNGAKAAIRVGYSKDAAKEIASRNLTKANIRSRIRQLMDERSQTTFVDKYFVVNRLLEVVDRCMQLVPVMEFDYAEKTMKQKTEGEGLGVWEFDSQGANKALELLGKACGMFTQNIDVSIEKKVFKVTMNLDR